MGLACNNCKKSAPEVDLKRCEKCSTTPYCSRECQKADWKAHKKVCGKRAEATTSIQDGCRTTNLSPPKGLEGGVASPFTRLDNGTWLHGRSEKDVYGLLIDAYRLRAEDMYNLEGEADADSIYGGAANGLRGFKRFLQRVERCPGLLPSWWDEKKKDECEALGMNPLQWYDLGAAVEKSDIIDQYGDSRFPMQLRMFAEAVYGRAPGGTNGKAMRQLMVAMEQGSVDRMESHMMDPGSMFGRQ
ncbi:MYND domain-containingprotein [Purpureocillium lilacinum]|uniref:MYND domain-containingprotein n=1 Tax=Purpureocillium lilacinum TaxID=33203 RepID=A0A179EXQ7_PURLI|nr:MYND domain-containingprotein [Purpureocillium lilacinum]OAQ57975.1 MYND domain-containingprotein [Purpureocillium lilacinum]